MKKRIFSILLTVCMLFCLVPISVFAEGVYEAADEHLRYALDDPTYSVCRLIQNIIISKPLEITREVTLDLNGYALALGGGGSVFVIKDGGHLTVIDSGPDAEHKFLPNSNGLWVWEERDGTETVSGGVITGGSAEYGGGVLIEDGGQLTLESGSIVGCYASGSGGGVKVKGFTQSGIFEMNGGAIIGCVAPCGGGVGTDYDSETVYGQFIMTGGVIDSCVATERHGGGVRADGLFTMTGGTIQNCTTKASLPPEDRTGGIFLSGDGRNIINGTIISGNVEDGKYIFVNNCDVTIGETANIQANIYVHDGGTVEMNAKATFNGAVTGNGSMYTPVKNESEFTNAVNNTGVSTIRLTADITLSSRQNITRSLTIDLNDRVLKMTGSGVFDVYYPNTRLTLTDTAETKTPKYFDRDESTGLWTLRTDNTKSAYSVTGGVITGGSAINVFSNGTAIMNGGSIVGCSADKGGAVVVNGGTFEMNSGAIIGCAATDGGAVYVFSNTFTMNGGSIEDCTANGGGAVFVNGGTFELTNGEIKNCTATDGSALYLRGKMNANGGTVGGTVVLDVKTDGSTGIIQGSGSTVTQFNGAVTNYGEIGHGTFNGTVTLGSSTLSGTISGGIFNGPVTTDSEGEAKISGGVFNKTVTINRGEITKGTFNKDVVVYNALGSFRCTTLTGGTYNGLIINKSAYAAFAGAHSPLGIVETKPSSQYSNDQYRTVTFDPAGGTMEYPVRYFFDDGNISKQIVPAPRAGYFFAGWYKADGTTWNYNDTVGEDDLTLTAHWTACDHSGHTGAQPTCTTSVTCTACGGEIAKLGHDWGTWTSNGDGTHTRTCQRDNAHKESNTCADPDKNHICDTCHATLSQCDDANKDHNCDYCGATLSQCADADKDHRCDLCGQTISNHSGGAATCRDKAVCEICGDGYGELDAANHADLRHVGAKASTKDAEGNIEYWYCGGCGKYFGDAAATGEIERADTVTAKLAEQPTSPKTGDNSTVMLWFALLFIGGVGTGLTVRHKKSYRRGGNGQ